MRKIAVFYSGRSQHSHTYKTSEFGKYIDACIPAHNFAEATLDEFDVLIIPSLSPINLLDANAKKIHAFANEGKTVVVFGSQHREWLPAHKWEFRPTNFWWSLEPGTDGALRLTDSTSDLFTNYLTLVDVTWHQHGIYWPTVDCETLVSTADGGSILYIDKVNSKGTWVITTLDPDFHYGSYFMQATERFLRGFLPWLKEGQI
jgi:hypothetical protein